MCRIARLNHAMDRDSADIVTGKRSIMRNIDHTGLFLSQQASELREAAGTIANRGREPKQTAIGYQSALDNSAKQVQINISSG